MIKATKVVLDVVEGHSEDCIEHIIEDGDPIEQADLLFFRILKPHAPDLGYNKTDASIIWEDGESYSFRFDVAKDTGSFSEELFRTILFYAGKAKPSHMTEDQYHRFLEETLPNRGLTAEHADFYRKTAEERQLLPLDAGKNGRPYGLPYPQGGSQSA